LRIFSLLNRNFFLFGGVIVFLHIVEVLIINIKFPPMSVDHLIIPTRGGLRAPETDRERERDRPYTGLKEGGREEEEEEGEKEEVVGVGMSVGVIVRVDEERVDVLVARCICRCVWFSFGKMIQLVVILKFRRFLQFRLYRFFFFSPGFQMKNFDTTGPIANDSIGGNPRTRIVKTSSQKLHHKTK
jgi:hypothetical protein